MDWETLQMWQGDWQELSPNAIENRRQYIEQTSYMVLGELADAIDRVRENHTRLMDAHCYGYRDQLAKDSSVSSTPHPNHLLDLAERCLTAGPSRRRSWFEAISLFDQATGVAHIKLHQPTEQVGHVLYRAIALVEHELFLPEFEKLDLYVHFDPAHDYVVHPGDVVYDKRLHRVHRLQRKYQLTCRRLMGDGLVYLIDRRKNPYQTWLKIQRQIQRKDKNPFVINDRGGLMFLVPTVQAVRALAHRVEELFLAHGATVIEAFAANYDVEASLDGKNADSSDKYKYANLVMRWCKQHLEFQFLTFHDYYTSQRALNDANHELYKLKQAIRYYLPLNWPTSLYDIDWTNPGVQGRLRAWKINQLGWVLKEHD